MSGWDEKKIHAIDALRIQVEEKISVREEARAKKDFAAADTIRKELAEQGVILEDRPDGTTRWKR